MSRSRICLFNRFMTELQESKPLHPSPEFKHPLTFRNAENSDNGALRRRTRSDRLISNKTGREIKKGSSRHLLWCAGQFCARGIECEGCQGTVVGLNQCHGALKWGNKCFLMTSAAMRRFSPITFEITWQTATICFSCAASPGCWHHRLWSLQWWHCRGTPGRSCCG